MFPGLSVLPVLLGLVFRSAQGRLSAVLEILCSFLVLSACLVLFQELSVSSAVVLGVLFQGVAVLLSAVWPWCGA